MTTEISTDLVHKDAMTGGYYGVALVAVVNPDGTPISGGGTSATDIAMFGGEQFNLGQMDAERSLSVVLANDHDHIPMSLFAVGSDELSLGNTTMAQSLPVTLASDQPALPVSVSNTVSVNATVIGTPNVSISGTPSVNATLVGTSNVAVTGTASTNIAQFGGLATSLGAKPMSLSMPVALALDQPSIPVSATVVGTASVAISGTPNVSVTNTVATNATIVGTPSVIISGTASQNIAQFGGVAVTLGQKVAASSIPVVLASDQVTATRAFAFVAGSTTTINTSPSSFNIASGSAASDNLQICNEGPNTAFVALGTVAQTASTGSYPILPGATVVIAGGGATNIAAISPGGASRLYISRGTGL